MLNFSFLSSHRRDIEGLGLNGPLGLLHFSRRKSLATTSLGDLVHYLLKWQNYESQETMKSYTGLKKEGSHPRSDLDK